MVKPPWITNCQNRSYMQNIISRITFQPTKVKNQQWHHRVSLVETLRKISDLILKGQGKNLASGQCHVMSKIGLLHFNRRVVMRQTQ